MALITYQIRKRQTTEQIQKVVAPAGTCEKRYQIAWFWIG
jgi:hypothetical protein